METNKHSQTALVVAWVRGYHYLHHTSPIFADELAPALVMETEREIVENRWLERLSTLEPQLAETSADRRTALEHAIRLCIPTIALARARYTEDSLLAAVGRGFTQYVLLGAGLDTFALRRPDLAGRLQVFEVDHPASQTFKRQRIAEAGLTCPPHLHFIPVDFEQDDLAVMLSRSAYQPNSLTMFGWLGVTYYLTREAIFDTLHAVRKVAAVGSEIIFDYVDRDAFDPSKAARRMQLTTAQTRSFGEPWLSGFDPNTLGAELVSVGYRLLEDLNPADQELRYFQGRTDGLHVTSKHAYIARARVE